METFFGDVLDFLIAAELDRVQMIRIIGIKVKAEAIGKIGSRETHNYQNVQKSYRQLSLQQKQLISCNVPGNSMKVLFLSA